MKLIIFNAFKNKKKYIIFYLLFQLIILLIFLLICNYEYYNYQINYNIGNKEINRGLEAIIDNRSNKNIIEKMENIDKFYPIYNNQYIFFESNLYQINYYNSNNIKYGRNIENDNELLISMYCYNQLNLNKDDLGAKEINLSYNNQVYKFIVVGVINNNHSQFYISLNTFDNIFNTKTNKYYLLVDEYLNVEKVKDKLKQINITTNIYDSTGIIEIEKIRNIQKKYFYTFILIGIFILYFIKNIIKNIIVSENKNIAILKALGYKNRTIKCIIEARLLIIITFTYLMSLLILIIISKFIKYINYLFVLKSVSLISLIITLIIFIDNLGFISKIKKLNILEILQEA